MKHLATNPIFTCDLCKGDVRDYNYFCKFGVQSGKNKLIEIKICALCHVEHFENCKHAYVFWDDVKQIIGVKNMRQVNTGNTATKIGANKYLIAGKCKITKEDYSCEVLITEYEEFIHGSALIQNAMPSNNADEREFVKTGISPKGWEQIFE